MTDPRRRHAARAAGLLVAVAVLAAVVLAAVWVGLRDIPLGTTLGVLLRDDGSVEAATIREVRVPRVLLGVLVGAALGLAGAVMQALTRNPLADPGLLGVTMGASTAVVVAIAFLGVTGVTGHLLYGAAGAATAAVAVYALGAAGRGAATPERLVLAGAALTAVLLAFNAAVLLLDPVAFNQFRFWNVGSIAGRRMDVVAPIAPWVLAGLVVALLLARPLNALALGEHTGRGLGVNVGVVRALGVTVVTVLCGAATAAAGPIVFVGLVVPHAARLLVGADQRWVLPYTAVLAPILLVGSDVVGRVVVAPAELQVGIVTALLGGPVFLALCLRRRLAEP